VPPPLASASRAAPKRAAPEPKVEPPKRKRQTVSERIAPKKRIGAVMSGNFGGGGGSDTKSRLMLFDLRNGQKLRETQEEFRPRRSLVAISPDADKIYIGTAGSDFEIFDAQLQRVRTVELPGEVVGRIHVVDG
jgi:hypothetical protein